MRLMFIPTFLFIVMYVNTQVIAKDEGKFTVHKISSITAHNNTMLIDPNVIIQNKNLDFFINDLQASYIKLSYKTGHIPRLISEFLESFSKKSFTMADPGGDWNCCCDNNAKLPNRQLICQGNDGHLFLMSYLSGGIGTINHIVLIQYNDNTITDFWAGTLRPDLKSKDAIVRYLINNKKKHWALNTNIISL
jgi:hypothetical protein